VLHRRDGRFVSGPYAGRYVVAQPDESGSIIALICDGPPESLETVADFWFGDFDECDRALASDGWDVLWLPEGSLGAPR
jgi:hypothetical protein